MWKVSNRSHQKFQTCCNQLSCNQEEVSFFYCCLKRQKLAPSNLEYSLENLFYHIWWKQYLHRKRNGRQQQVRRRQPIASGYCQSLSLFGGKIDEGLKQSRPGVKRPYIFLQQTLLYAAKAITITFLPIEKGAEIHSVQILDNFITLRSIVCGFEGRTKVRVFRFWQKNNQSLVYLSFGLWKNWVTLDVRQCKHKKAFEHFVRKCMDILCKALFLW